MALYFQSIISGSSGNCLLLWTGKSTLLIDVGFGSQSHFMETLGHLLPTVDGVIISHLHSDHVRYPALRVIEKYEFPVYVHKDDIRLLGEKHFLSRPFSGLNLRPFSSRQLRIGEFSIKPFEVPHQPSRVTFGFEVSCTQQGKQRRVVIATDFWDWDLVKQRFQDADFIYVESNHDPDMLRENYQPNAEYHLSNPKCGHLLQHAFDHSTKRPATVMLGHLSEERNTHALAHDTVAAVLDKGGHGGVKLHIAPRHEPSEVIRVFG
jgi:phosphoribosyl 1,2-cyclic phosphodiesterase